MSQVLSFSYESPSVHLADSKRTTPRGDGGRSSCWRPASCKMQLRWASPAAYHFGCGDARERLWEWTERRHRRRARHGDSRSTFRDGYESTTHTTSHTSTLHSAGPGHTQGPLSTATSQHASRRPQPGTTPPDMWPRLLRAGHLSHARFRVLVQDRPHSPVELTSLLRRAPRTPIGLRHSVRVHGRQPDRRTGSA